SLKPHGSTVTAATCREAAAAKRFWEVSTPLPWADPEQIVSSRGDLPGCHRSSGDRAVRQPLPVCIRAAGKRTVEQPSCAEAVANTQGRFRSFPQGRAIVYACKHPFPPQPSFGRKLQQA